MQNQAISLSIEFFEDIKGFKRGADGKILANDSYKNLIMKTTLDILQQGISPQEISELMQRYKIEHEHPDEVYSIKDILSYFNIKPQGVKRVRKDPSNLIESGKFYYHPVLQVTPPPPTVKILPDGTFESSYETEEFFLEIRESFTIDNLVDYYYEVMNNKKYSIREKDAGAFKHMIGTHSLDIILFAIDTSSAMAEASGVPKPKTPFEIRDYIQEAFEVFEERKNTCYMEGLDRVIPRRYK